MKLKLVYENHDRQDEQTTIIHLEQDGEFIICGYNLLAHDYSHHARMLPCRRCFPNLYLKTAEDTPIMVELAPARPGSEDGAT